MTDVTEPQDPQLVPTLTDKTPTSDRVEGQAAVIDGRTVNVRKTHPNLWRSVMAYAAINALLGLNFILLHPTFLIYETSNYVWGGTFLTLAAAKIVFLNLYRHLGAVRVAMAAEIAFMFFIAVGATEPFLDGIGSLQNPILYVGLAVLELPLLLEPFINPWTARRD